MLLIEVSCSSDSSKKIDQLAEQTLKEWEIPGLALAVVHKGKEVRVAGYGVKERGGFDKVNADTLFQICSLTKAFTGVTVGMLVEEGKLKLEQPIRSYLPKFQLKDPVATEQMTLRDLLSQHTGLPGLPQGESLFWWNTGRTTEDLIHRLAYVEPAFPFRSHFTYNNMSYVISSQIVATAAGMPWHQFCKERVFEPLGMRRTNTSYESLTHDSNVALPHLLPHILEKPIVWGNWESLVAAAGINSCASDMALWLKYCLSNSVALQVTQRPQVLFEVEGFLEKVYIPMWSILAHGQPIANYGLGWMIYTLDNKTVFFHTGLSAGMQSILAVIPEDELGIAILTNEMGHPGAACLLNLLIDHLLGREEVDWNQKAHTVIADIDQTVKLETVALENSRLKNVPPTLNKEGYMGEYVHPAYGSIVIGMENEMLTIEFLFNHEKGKLEHWQENQFKITDAPSMAPFLPWLMAFQLSQDQHKVINLTMPYLGVFEYVGNSASPSQASDSF